MKRIVCLIAALTLLLAMSATVFAADDTYTITISGDNVVAGHIYEAYQIFKGDLAEKDSVSVEVAGKAKKLSGYRKLG